MTKITVPMAPPSPNQLRRKYRSPHAYKKLREAWENSLAYGVASADVHHALKRQAQNKRVRVAIAIHTTKAYDEDNLYGCLKPVLDALKNIGFIRDDSKKWLELAEVKQYPGTKNYQTTIIEIG